jgi:hypothetical protein
VALMCVFLSRSGWRSTPRVGVGGGGGPAQKRIDMIDAGTLCAVYVSLIDLGTILFKQNLQCFRLHFIMDRCAYSKCKG